MIQGRLAAFCSTCLSPSGMSTAKPVNYCCYSALANTSKQVNTVSQTVLNPQSSQARTAELQMTCAEPCIDCPGGRGSHWDHSNPNPKPNLNPNTNSNTTFNPNHNTYPTVSPVTPKLASEQQREGGPTFPLEQNFQFFRVRIGLCNPAGSVTKDHQDKEIALNEEQCVSANCLLLKGSNVL